MTDTEAVDVQCPQCGYQTVVWRSQGDDPARCPECSVEADITDLTLLSGVGREKAGRLEAYGYETIRDVYEADQSTLAEIVGNALAPRIEADLKSDNGLGELFDSATDDELLDRIGATDKAAPPLTPVEPDRDNDMSGLADSL